MGGSCYSELDFERKRVIMRLIFVRDFCVVWGLSLIKTLPRKLKVGSARNLKRGVIESF